MSEPDVIAVALQCAGALEAAGVGYFLGGSLASSLQGEPRATNDIDFVIDLRLPQRSEFERRRRVVLTRDGQGLFIKSPEDSVLRKLLWFREGGGTSTTQWRDIVQVLRVTGGQMDLEYLNGWAGRLGVETLLAQARTEAR